MKQGHNICITKLLKARDTVKCHEFFRKASIRIVTILKVISESRSGAQREGEQSQCSTIELVNRKDISSIETVPCTCPYQNS